jgi:choline dehydrogenase-like flavoprotein
MPRREGQRMERMSFTKRMFFACTLAASLVATADGTVSSDPGAKSTANSTQVNLESVHRALFDTFFPTESPKLTRDQRQHAERNRDEGYQTILNSPVNAQALKLFSDLTPLTDAQGIKALADATKTPLESDAEVLTEAQRLKVVLASFNRNPLNYSELPLYQREIIMKSLLTSNVAVIRRASRNTKSAYLSLAYGRDLNFELAGIPPPIQESTKLPNPPTIAPPQLKTHLTYNRASHQLEGEIDYVVVGSGPAGALVASELQKSGKKVLLLEQGHLAVPGRFDGRSLSQFRNSKTPSTDDGAIVLVNAAVVGGGANINGDLVMPMTEVTIQSRFAGWHRVGRVANDVWTQEELIRAGREVERKIGTRSLTQRDLSTAGKLLITGATKRGEARRVRYYKVNTHSIDPRAEVTNKISPVEKLILPAALDRQNPLTLLPNASVQRVLFGSLGAAEGVEFVIGKHWDKDGIVDDPYQWEIPEGETIRVRANTVILSAGTLGSTTILKNSGISNPNIGRGAVVLPMTAAVTGLFDRVVNIQDNQHFADAYLDYRSADPEKEKANFLLLAVRYPPLGILTWMPGSREQILDYVINFRRTSTILINLMDHSRPENHVEVKNGKPVVQYRLSKEECETIAYAMSEAANNLLSAGAKAVFVQSNVAESEGDRLTVKMITTKQQADALRNLKINAHQIPLHGTQLMAANKMGRSPGDSVVNSDHQVWGVENLYVVDASVFPDAIGPQPMQTIYTIAKLFVGNLLKREHRTSRDALNRRGKAKL